jgi:hypothetical protein
MADVTLMRDLQYLPAKLVLGTHFVRFYMASYGTTRL